jgi:hypothetical protein
MRRLSLLVALLSLTACVPNKQFRKSVSVFPPVPGDSPYTLAFVEFDDMGEFWDRTQLNRALQAITEAKKEKGQVIVVTFVHGWKNNASDDSGNVWGFRDELKDIESESHKRFGDTPVVGIYIGWRGAVTNVPFLKNLTFYDRRDAAIRIPGANITEALHQIMRTTKQNADDKSICVLIGHSFGGMVLERALTQSMVSLINDYEARNKGKDAPVPMPPSTDLVAPADLIAFVNSAAPATESKQFMGMLKVRGYHLKVDGKDEPFFLSITSKGDMATGLAMPIAQAPSKITKSMREYDLSNPEQHPEFPPGVKSQSTYYLHSTANSPAVQSHEILFAKTADELRRIRQERQVYSCFPVHSNVYCIVTKQTRWNDTPYWAMQMPVEFVPDHGSIFRPEFRELLRHFLPVPPKAGERPRTLYKTQTTQ